MQRREERRKDDIELLKRYSSWYDNENRDVLIEKYAYLINVIMLTEKNTKDWLMWKGWYKPDKDKERRELEIEQCADIGLLQPYYNMHIYTSLREAVALELSSQLFSLSVRPTVEDWLIGRGWSVGEGEYNKIIRGRKYTVVSEDEAVMHEILLASTRGIN